MAADRLFLPRREAADVCLLLLTVSSSFVVFSGSDCMSCCPATDGSGPTDASGPRFAPGNALDSKSDVMMMNQFGRPQRE